MSRWSIFEAKQEAKQEAKPEIKQEIKPEIKQEPNPVIKEDPRTDKIPEVTKVSKSEEAVPQRSEPKPKSLSYRIVGELFHSYVVVELLGVAPKLFC